VFGLATHKADSRGKGLKRACPLDDGSGLEEQHRLGLKVDVEPEKKAITAEPLVKLARGKTDWLFLVACTLNVGWEKTNAQIPCLLWQLLTVKQSWRKKRRSNRNRLKLRAMWLFWWRVPVICRGQLNCKPKATKMPRFALQSRMQTWTQQ